MTLKLGINGFGRIGRGLVRALIENDIQDMEIVAINDLASIDGLANLLKYDSIHGRLKAKVEVVGDTLVVNGKPIRMTALRDPAGLPWQDVDLVMECTGVFKSRDRAALHLENGAKKVLVSAPGKDMDRTVVYGVNHRDLTADDVVVSNGSCTTNCLAPLAMVLDREFGIETGFMTTIHAFTGSQPSLDASNSDPYRARAASLSMVPTTTGATKALSLVLPNLKGRIEGAAVRVPTPNVSLVDLCFMPRRTASVEDINKTMRRASEGELAGILSYEIDPMVSIDFNHDPHSSCFAPAQTAVTDQGMVRVVSWYDNEWGFTNRMFDTARQMMALV